MISVFDWALQVQTNLQLIKLQNNCHTEDQGPLGTLRVWRPEAVAHIVQPIIQHFSGVYVQIIFNVCIKILSHSKLLQVETAKLRRW